MKRFFTAALAFLLVGAAFTGSAFGMEATSVEQPSAILYVPDIRLLIADYIFRTSSEKNAILSFRAWNATDTKAWKLFKENEQLTIGLLKQLYTLSYRSYFDLTFLKQLTPQLPSSMVEAFQKGIKEAESLKALFITCAQEKCWDTASEKIESLKKDSVTLYCMNNYYWQDSCILVPIVQLGDFAHATKYPTKKTLLIYALQQHAPIKVITELINCGASCIQADSSILPSCIEVCLQMIEWNMYYNLQCSQQDADLTLIDKEMKPAFEQLTTLMELLIEKGASLDDSFQSLAPGFREPFSKTAPLLIALNSQDLSTVNYLNKKGVELPLDHFKELLLEIGTFPEEHVMNKDAFFNFLNPFVRTMPKDKYPFLMCLIVMSAHFTKPHQQEKILNLFKMILAETDTPTLTCAVEGMTILDRVLATTGNTDMITLLEERGAIRGNNEHNEYEKMKQVFDLFIKLSSILESERYNEEPLQEAKSILKEAQELLATPLIKEIMPTLLSWAFTCPVEWDETKNFLLSAATNNWLPVEYGSYGPTPSIFHYIVARIYKVKEQLQLTLPNDYSEKTLIIWLAQQGIKDDLLCRGKTAEEKAQALGMPDVAECIRSSFLQDLSANQTYDTQ